MPDPTLSLIVPPLEIRRVLRARDRRADGTARKLAGRGRTRFRFSVALAAEYVRSPPFCVFHVNVEHRGEEKCNELGKSQPSEDRHSQGPTRFAACPNTQ